MYIRCYWCSSRLLFDTPLLAATFVRISLKGQPDGKLVGRCEGIERDGKKDFNSTALLRLSYASDTRLRYGTMLLVQRAKTKRENSCAASDVRCRFFAIYTGQGSTNQEVSLTVPFDIECEDAEMWEAYPLTSIISEIRMFRVCFEHASPSTPTKLIRDFVGVKPSKPGATRVSIWPISAMSDVLLPFVYYRQNKKARMYDLATKVRECLQMQTKSTRARKPLTRQRRIVMT
jgi:hypothetical protein